MFERFDRVARRVVVIAHDEARTLSHPTIGPEHLLLGLLREGNSPAATLLTLRGIDYDAVRVRVEAAGGRGAEPAVGQVSHAEAMDRVMRHCLEESVELGHTVVGPEHLLLALLREDDAVRVFAQLDVDADEVRQHVISQLG